MAARAARQVRWLWYVSLVWMLAEGVLGIVCGRAGALHRPF
jgi:hypothetical protein